MAAEKTTLQEFDDGMGRSPMGSVECRTRFARLQRALIARLTEEMRLSGDDQHYIRGSKAEPGVGEWR